MADPERVAELRQQRETLDPLALSAPIQAKLERVFRLSTKTRANAPPPHETWVCAARPPPPASTGGSSRLKIIARPETVEMTPTARRRLANSK